MSQNTKVTKLDNGMRVATHFIPHVKTISMGLWVDVGARYELPEEAGMSHFLEHMAFKGTRTRTAYDIVQQIEAVGGDLNAATSQDTTAYYVTLLAEDWRLGLDVLADIVLNSTFPEEEIERERDVVLQEIDQTEDAPDDVVFEMAQKISFPDQALGCPILGPKENIKSFKKEDLERFVHKHYKSNRLLFVAAGCVDHDLVVEAVSKAFSGAKRGEDLILGDVTYGGGEISQRKPLEQNHLVLGFEGVSLADSGYTAMQAYAGLLGGGMASRLFQEIREKRGLVYGISSFPVGYRDTGLFYVYTSTSQNKIEALIEIILEEMMKTSQHLTEEEVIRAKTQIKAHMLMAEEKTSFWVGRIGRQLLHLGRIVSTEEWVRKVEEIDGNQLKKIAEKLLQSKLVKAKLCRV